MPELRPADQWAALREQARPLPDAELRRHYLVSTRNNHLCVDCFCCACGAVLAERRRQQGDDARRAAAILKGTGLFDSMFRS